MVFIRARVHPFPFRTRKLSSLLPKILVWRRTGKIGNANTKQDSQLTVLFYITHELVGVHNQIHTDPVTGLALLQSFVKDADTKRGGGSAATFLTAERNHSRACSQRGTVSCPGPKICLVLRPGTHNPGTRNLR